LDEHNRPDPTVSDEEESEGFLEETEEESRDAIQIYLREITKSPLLSA